MKIVKRILCIFLCLVLCLGSFAACGEAEVETVDKSKEAVEKAKDSTLQNQDTGDADAKYADSITFYGMKMSVIDTANPAFYTPQASWYTYNVFNTLVKATVEYEYVPCLATSWETTDYKTFDFKLRDDVKFHNGEKFTAADVAYTIERGRTAKGTRAYDIMNRIESYEIVNDYEIKMTLTKVNVDFIDDMSLPGSAIVNQKAIESDPDHGSWIGTGPWKVKEMVVNEYTVFERNEDYWGEKPKTKTMTIRNIAEQSAQLIALQNGELDSVQGLSPMYLPDLEKDENFTCTPFVVNNVCYVGFNMLNKITGDKNFRLAVAYALQRQDNVNAVRSGYAVPFEYGTFWGYSTQYKNTSIPLIDYDLDKAKEYLKASCYNGEKVEIVAATNDHIKNATVVQAALIAIGIDAVVYETDAAGLAAYTKSGSADYQMICYSAAFTNLASSVKTVLYPGTSSNKANYDNPKVTELLDEAAMTLDDAERESIYMEIQEIVAEDMPYIGIMNFIYEIVSRKGVGGLGIYPTLSHDWSYAYRVIE